MPIDPDRSPLEEPLAELERILIDTFVAGAGADATQLRARTDPDARALLTRAAQYAAERLSEVEARAHYVRSLRGEV
jgi:hypothetical protein